MCAKVWLRTSNLECVPLKKMCRRFAYQRASKHRTADATASRKLCMRDSGNVRKGFI